MQFSRSELEFILRRDLMGFIVRSFYELNPQTKFFESPHIEVMASKLEACRQGKIKRLIVNMPPRALKSHAVSVAFVAWLLGHDPTKQIICASYGQELADKHARDCRTLMASSFFRRLFPRTRLSPDKQAVNDFMTTEQGFRMSTSVTGVLTGRGADVIILDDPLKPEEALSETRRNSVNDWYSNTLLSRLNNKETGVIIIVMQRLHQDDLVGHVMEQGNWEVLSFPAIAEEDETHIIENPWGKRTFQRKAGEVLQPERESKFTLDIIRKNTGEYDFSSQYQQSPMPLGGAIIKTQWLRYYDLGKLPERFISVLQSWDTANKSGDLNDFSVCTTWGVVSGFYYLLHVFRARLNYPDLKRAVQDQAQREHAYLHPANTILIEDKASGTQLIQDLQVEGVLHVTPYDPPPGSDKLIRLYSQSAEFENGRVLLPSSASWLDEYIRELTGQVVRFVKAERVGINMMDIAVCGAIAPYNILLGGKLVSLLLCSPEIIKAYQARYGEQTSLIASCMRGASVKRKPNLVLLCTTSLYGAPLNQYSRLKMPAALLGGRKEEKIEYECLGTSEGFGSFHFSKDTLRMIETLLGRSKEARKVNSIFGEGVNPLMRKIREGLALLGLPADVLLKHGSKRLVYGIALAQNFEDYLLGFTNNPRYLIPGSRPKFRTELIADFWRQRWLLKRLSKEGVLDEVARHNCVYPIRHGAQVQLPKIDGDVLELFEWEPGARRAAI